MIPYGRQHISEADVAAVTDVLRSDYLTQGPAVPRFEHALAARCGARHAVAANSGTSALHLACRALALGPGDWLWTSPNTFAASANCALYCGARVDFVDIDPGTLNLSIAALETKLEQAERLGRLPRVLVPVHFAGLPCDMAAVGRLSQRYGFRVVEDASHALGAAAPDHPVGACRFSDITVFSFHPVKIVTTGEGGAALTNDPALAQRMALLRSHGITREAGLMEGENEGPWYYQQVDLGYNYRMTDIQAALGASQLQRLDAFLTRRRELAERYRATFAAGWPLDMQDTPAAYASAWHLCVVRLHEAARRRVVFDALRGAGIGVNVHYIPVHLHPWYRRLGFKPGDFPAAEGYYAGALTLPLHPGLTEAEHLRVIAALAAVLDIR
jgi:UDP-4-amino-4,6-dideoxy-N-acetyl-beta-L-altrosamine transaminase